MSFSRCTSMPRQYLFGPVSASFAEQHLWQHSPGDNCSVFDFSPGVDVVARPDHDWERLIERMPEDRRPAFLVLYPQYKTLPPWLLRAPVPIIALAGDGNLQWHGYRALATCFDLVLTDMDSAERFSRS